MRLREIPPSGVKGYERGFRVTSAVLSCPQLLYHTQTQDDACRGVGWTASGAGGRYPSEPRMVGGRPGM